MITLGSRRSKNVVQQLASCENKCPPAARGFLSQFTEFPQIWNCESEWLKRSSSRQSGSSIDQSSVLCQLTNPSMQWSCVNPNPQPTPYTTPLDQHVLTTWPLTSALISIGDHWSACAGSCFVPATDHQSVVNIFFGFSRCYLLMSVSPLFILPLSSPLPLLVKRLSYWDANYLQAAQFTIRSCHEYNLVHWSQIMKNIAS